MFKTISGLVLCAVVAAGGLSARGEITSGVTGRYWFDFSGEKHPFTPGSLEISTDALDDGFHSFHAYIEENANVSATHTKWFIKVRPKLTENQSLTCTFYLDGKVFETGILAIGSDGAVGSNLDMNNVDLGVHIITAVLANEKGIPVAHREGVFLRVPTGEQRTTFSTHYYLDGKYVGKVDAGAETPVVNLNLDVSALTAGIHSITAYLCSPLGMSTSSKTAWFIKTPSGGEGVKEYSYWINENESTRKHVTLSEITPHFRLVNLLDVPEMPFRSKSYTFAVENGVPALYACNDFKVCFTDPDGRLSTASQNYTDTRVKIVPTEVSEINEGLTSTGSIPENSVELYKFNAVIGDSINVRLDHAAMLEIYDPEATTLKKVSGADAINNQSFTAKRNGTYFIAVHDVASGNAVNIEFSRIHKFAMLGQNVTHSANHGVFELIVDGNGFNSLKSLKLVNGDNEYPITTFRAKNNYKLYALIDLDENNLELGDYHLKGHFSETENGVGENIVSNSVLTIENPTSTDLNVTIEAPRIAGTPYLAYIKVSNKSNVGVWGIPFNIAAQHTPNGGKIEFMDFEIVLDEKYKDNLPVVHKTDNLFNTGNSGSFAPTVIPYLAPGETKTYTIGFTTSPHEIVTLYAWLGTPWSEDIPEVCSADFDTSVFTRPFEGNLFTFPL